MPIFYQGGQKPVSFLAYFDQITLWLCDFTFAFALIIHVVTFTTFFLIMLTFLSFLFLETLTSQLINSFSAFCNTTMPLAFLPYLRVSSLYIHITLTPYTPFPCQDLCTFSAVPFLLMHCNFVIYVWGLLHTLLSLVT